MFFTLRELLRWLGVTVFELLALLVCLAVFTVLLVLKVEGEDVSVQTFTETSWWWIFSPLFVCDAVNAYFCIIVFIRMHVEVK